MARVETHAHKITPFLWYDGKAEEAARFYTSIFENSEILGISRYGDAGPGAKGSVMTVTFTLDGQRFIALNGGPDFKFNPSVSFFISCETQSEVDELWEKLSAGGEKSQCGWVQDRYGLSWQVVPSMLLDLVGDKDAAVAQRVMQAMLRMTKIDIAAIEKAAAG